MPLTPGTRLGPYEIIAPLGAGGMGEVFRATDTRLGRDVAVKVLPQHLSANPEVRARFEREAKTVSSLNHPHICTLHDVGREGDIDYLVMELVEGETLAQRLAKGALPAAEVLRLGGQITDALDRAHRAGVIHRDLKPGNVMLTRSGAKLMDFGLARATGMAGPASGSGVTVAALTQSPTVAAPLTAEGTIVGTFQYMAPEQLEGREADARSDLWALGCVLYEMATGKRAFEGKSQASLITSIMGSQPAPISLLAPLTPPGFERLVQACLAKDPADRLQSAHDIRMQLAWLAEGGSQAGVPAPARSGAPRWLVGGLTIVATIAATSTAWWFLSGKQATTLTQLAIALPEGHRLTSGPAISRDGRRIAFVSTDGVSRPHLYVRDLGEPDSRRLSDTEEADDPFFSPDGQWIAYYAGNGLFKMRVDGGAPVRLARSTSHYGGTWTDDGTIIFKETWNGGLHAVGEDGGAVRTLLALSSADEYAYAWPYALPGRHEILFASWGKRFEAVLLDTRTMKRRVAATNWWGRYAYAPGGQFFNARSGELIARDLRGSSDKGGKSVTVVQGLDSGGFTGEGRYDVSQNGTLAYLRWKPPQRTLVMVDRRGQAVPIDAGSSRYDGVQVSPDGHRACAQVGMQLRIVDLDRGTVAPLSEKFEGASGAQTGPCWSSDGRTVTFASNHGGDWDIYSMSASGAGEPTVVLKLPFDQFLASFAPDGTLLFSSTHPKTGGDLWLKPPHGEPHAWLATEAEEWEGCFSPDGRYVAYSSNATGRLEVYVQALDNPADRTQVSAAGGSTPAWSPDGRSLFFRQGNLMMAATVRTTGGVSAAVPERLFDGGWALPGQFRFAVMPDGQHFLMVRQPPDAMPAQIDVVLGWAATLEAKMRK